MFTKNGKIVFACITLVIVLLAGFLFLKSTPDVQSPIISEGENTETRFTVDEQKLATLNKPLSTFDIDADTASGSLYFSPDGHYALFEAEPTPVKGQMEKGSRVILADLGNGTMKKIYDGLLAGAPSWSNGFVAFASDGVYIYDFKQGVLNVVSQAGSRPLISPDEHFVAYQDNGLNLFSVASRATTVLTSNTFDIPAMWFDDGTKLLMFKSDGTNLGDGAGDRQFVASLDTVTKAIHEFASVPRGKFYGAKPVGENVWIMGGFDDGRSDYILSLKNDTTVTLDKNVSVSEVMVKSDSEFVYVYEGGVLKKYNSQGDVVTSVSLVDSFVAPHLPLSMSILDKSVWLSYTQEGTFNALLKSWDLETGEFQKEVLPGDGAATFFSNTSIYVLLSKDRTTLQFKKLQ